MKYLFLFTIAPVQSFISQSRKTQDLYAGSQMLSILMKKAFKEIMNQDGKPKFPIAADIDSVPNRILAEFDKEESELNNIGEDVASITKITVDEWCRMALDKIKKDGGDVSKIEGAFKKQLKNYFSTYWVFIKIEDGQDGYRNAYSEADRMLGAVKNLRAFSQYPEQGRKCSLNGEQNALVFHKKVAKYANDATTIHNINIRANEGLCAISYIKRFFPLTSERPSFDATANIAVLNALHALHKKENAIEPMGNLTFCLNEKSIYDVDARLYYPEEELKSYFEENEVSEMLQVDLRRNLNQIKKIAKDGKIKFVKYYAILIFDADSMGKWLSGDYLIDKNQLEDFHSHISGLLSTYATNASNFVDGKIDGIKRGRTVYAGGDDYLGFINLHYLFDVLKELRRQFKIQVSDQLRKGYEIINDTEISFSAGIAIAHYKTPMSEVLNWARSMEHEAKERSEQKDSFGVAVLKHSGEIHKSVLPFTQNSYWFTDKLKNIVESLNGKFSNKFMTSLDTEMSLIADVEKGRLDDDIVDAIKFEIDRLVAKAKINAQKPEVLILQNDVKAIFEISNNPKIPTNFESPTVNFNYSLGICDFINRKLRGNG